MSEADPQLDDDRSYASYLLQLRDDLDRTEVSWRETVLPSFLILAGAPFLYATLATGAPLGVILMASAMVLLPALFLGRLGWLRHTERNAILTRIAQIEERPANRKPSMSRVQIGKDAGSITHVDGGVVRYVDESGRSRVVVLRPGLRGTGTASSPASEQPRYVGARKLDQAPWTVTLNADPRVTFEFDGFEEAYELLLGPLREHKLMTLDTT